MEEEVLIPGLTEEIVAAIEKQFPDRLPGMSATVDMIRYRQGQVSVAQFLREQLTRQMEG